MTQVCIFCGQMIEVDPKRPVAPTNGVTYVHIATGDEWCNGPLAGYKAKPDPIYTTH